MNIFFKQHYFKALCRFLRSSISLSYSQPRGSVLIIVVIIAGILFSIGIVFAFILEREVSRQAYNKQSQFILHLTNSVLECVLYNDFRRSAFSSEGLFSSGIVPLDCGSYYQVRNINQWGSQPYVPLNLEDQAEKEARLAAYRFKVVQSSVSALGEIDSAPCAYVTLKRECSGLFNNSRCSDSIISSVEVQGYYSCFDGHNQTDSGQVVRRVKIFY